MHSGDRLTGEARRVRGSHGHATCIYTYVTFMGHTLRGHQFSRMVRDTAGEYARDGHERPAGRHGGPSAIPLRPARRATTATTSESYTIERTYEQAMEMIRRAVSKQGLQILRECDIGSRIQPHVGAKVKDCRVLYVTHHDLLIRAVSADPSAALWLPVPVVVVDESNYTRILIPCKAIVRDRALLLGVEELVGQFYECLTLTLDSIGARQQEIEHATEY
jgi:uncharacterized protein (DUF302 family)